ncbi:hypothetical protein [Larkinella soli]|uniref:hypothetical protein n=1 Tax=Larkinella soli TaxID=1770527 RepID=UPI000FFC9CB5|nr:hypothetical protein [Larkinella soli]
MNAFAKHALAALALVFSLSLTSCDRENAIAPGRPEAGETVPRPTGNTPNDGPVSVFKKYTLVKYGHWQLTYDNTGDLVKKQSTIDPTLFREYSRASNGSGMTILDMNGGKMSGKTLILFDGKGRAKESFITKYGFANGQQTAVTTRFAYQYNADNRLEKITNLDNGNHYFLFTYNGNGDRSKVEMYNSGKKTVTTYTYVGFNQPLIPDYNRMNLAWMPLYDKIDEHLPIYGKANKNLPRNLEFLDVPSGQVTDKVSYKYNLNADGYILQREETRQTAGQTLVDTFSFDYIVSMGL